MSVPTFRSGVRSTGLRKLKSTPSSAAMSLEDETQQPPVAGSSQTSAAHMSAAIFEQFQQQYASSVPSGPSAAPTPRATPIIPHPPLVAPSSDLTQEPESDGSIAWESNTAPIPPSSSLRRSSLGHIEEEPQPQASEINDGGSSGGSDISTPPNSNPEAASTPTRASKRSLVAPLRPITQSVPGGITSSTRQLISPSRHATMLTTPAKTTQPLRLSPTNKLTDRPTPSLTKVGSPSSSARPPPSPSPSPSPTPLTRPIGNFRTAQNRSPSPDESSDFADDMLPTRPLKPRERFETTMRATSLSPKQTFSAEGDPACYTEEPTFLNEDDHNVTQEAGSDKHSGTGKTNQNAGEVAEDSNSAVLQVYPSATAEQPNSSSPLPTAPRLFAAGQGSGISQTQLNTVISEGSQTQLNSDDRPPPSSPVPRGHFASINARSAAVPSSLELWEESMPDDEDIGAPGQMSPQHETFVATQVKSLPPSTSSPFRQLSGAVPSSSPLAESRGNCARSTTATSRDSTDMPRELDGELEPTFVDAGGHVSDGSLPAAASDPFPPILPPSSVERPRRSARAAASTSVIPAPQPAPINHCRTQEETATTMLTPTKKRPLEPESSKESLLPAQRPRRSPYKYGKRYNRPSAIPSSRVHVPHQLQASEGPLPTPLSHPEGGSPPSHGGSGTQEASASAASADDASRPDSSSAPRAEPFSSMRTSSTSSSSAPDDPDDTTFPGTLEREDQQSLAGELITSLPSLQLGAPIARSKSTPVGMRHTTAVPNERATSRAGSRPVRDKRKTRSSSPEFSESSSSAPEDVEDSTYRPVEAAVGPSKGKAKRAPATPPKPKLSKRPRKEAVSTSVRAPPPKPNKRTRTIAAGARPRSLRPASSASRTKGAQAVAAPPDIPPLRVLAQWRDSTDFYAGTVVARDASGHHIMFDDGHTECVEFEQMRLLELRPGEPVCEKNPSHMFHLVEQYDGQGDIRVVNANNKVHRIQSKYLLVLGLDIVRRFSNRRVPREELDKRFPDSIAAFAGKVFIVTGSEEKDAVAKKIQRNGGVVANDWTDLFDITEDGHAISAQGTPYLVSLGPKRAVSSKLMSSLAAGVPVLSPRYVDDSLKGHVDWRAYLVSPGESALLREPAVQVVDTAWGSASWNPKTAQAVRQPLAGSSVLWIPARTSWKGHDEINTLLPFCLRAMGARVTITGTLPGDLVAVKHDLVVVEDRDGRTLTKSQRASGKLVNVGWLKAVLMAGARLPPSILRN
ncbi:hypothetical protein CC85DRAFT_78539 [Cutaneotrichosporon oleaginosum]|uniref:BRCT domain-containing protein n=1 Tax=Cutaneotrichosporon oleaginosum TaxID=879819 RepID=A0A0J0XNT7_9TREE|nr:uncharacterized protein CC85DRAFT_78539 [Cutaneotrichosporon oleaginosum]KLT42752.1 hypothetical protein CC85DRAFT_78539 [Cutaneotrichosporon oleaginosum]TXT09529.1 hypothetical protein COLE_03463 [Cutaneotrichosporon oleaginosum]